MPRFNPPPGWEPDTELRKRPRTAVVLGSLAAVALAGTVAVVVMTGLRSAPSAHSPPSQQPIPGTLSTTVVPPPPSVTDAHGFTVFHGGARCFEADVAAMFMRTDRSALVVCSNGTGGLYYRGYRISDGASIDLYDVRREGGGFVAVNDPDDARYAITPAGSSWSRTARW